MKNASKPLMVLLGLLFTLLMSSCDSREADLQRTIEKQIDTASDHLLYFWQFKKIDGVEKQDGALRYEMTFKGRIDANKNVIWKPVIYSSFRDQAKLKMEKPIISTDSTDVNFLRRDWGINVQGTAVFEKRDSGWKLIAIDL